jgi:hypothetical protein
MFWPSSGVLKFRGTAVPSMLLQLVFPLSEVNVVAWWMVNK